ncbi:hypothetical protein B843_03960 [Corynebacterium vitaeruminis DSM 20294]|uniref:Integral membrane protein n=1 Tax=Corynebacterium vitaeruminis DSM 20294 TaxID=1224164 RepID=W5XYT8_9CORY|nr:hypothetical protein B843_03960 [Corynebacterium vitaeruminis DSM 20294]
MEQIRAGRFPRRFAQLMVGLSLFGLGLALIIVSGLGAPPWSVLEVAVAHRAGLSVGSANIIISFLVLAAWVPLRIVPGLGTVLNAIWIGVSIDASMRFLAAPDPWWAKALMMAVGIVVVGFASSLYIGAQFGPGPRDGLMTGLHSRFGWSIARVRIGLEVAVLAAGWLLGGPVGIGTVAYAAFLGPIIGATLAPCIVPLGDLEDSEVTD